MDGKKMASVIRQFVIWQAWRKYKSSWERKDIDGLSMDVERAPVKVKNYVVDGSNAD